MSRKFIDVSNISARWVHNYEKIYLKYKFDHLTFGFLI